MFINCLQKYPYRAAGIEEESKHCSAPGSQVQTDNFSPATWQEKEGIPVPASVPSASAGLAEAAGWAGAVGAAADTAGQGWDARGEAGGTRQGMHRAQVNKNKLLEQPRAAAGEPRAAAAVKEHGLCPGLMVDSAQGCCSRSPGRENTLDTQFCQQTRGSPRAGGPGGARGGPHSRRNVKRFHTCSLLLFCSHFFFPLSVFPTHVLLPESILIMHDFFFHGASFPASLSAAESEKIVLAATSAKR